MDGAGAAQKPPPPSQEPEEELESCEEEPPHEPELDEESEMEPDWKASVIELPAVAVER